MLILPVIASGQHRPCSADDILKTQVTENPTQWQDQERSIRDRITDGPVAVFARNSVVIPVVFHIVYREARDSLSDLQIQTQLDILNRDMNGLCENRDRIPAQFKAAEAAAGIRFCLAAEDPEGSPSTGIIRKRTIQDNIGTQIVFEGRRAVFYSTFGGSDAWDPIRYLNIWVADIGELLGTATFPGMAPFPEEDGVLISPRATGALGSAGQNGQFDRGHTLTHEIGHYLNLLHTWGNEDGCEEDDLIADTPDQAVPYGGCPRHPQVSCGSPDMFMNFMDLTNDRCIAFFTEGQKERMLATLEVLRPGLLNGSIACTSDFTEPTPISTTHVFYSTSDQKIVLTDNAEIQVPVEVTIFTIDGKFIRKSIWRSGQTYLIDFAMQVPGIYLVLLDDGRNNVSHKVPVIR